MEILISWRSSFRGDPHPASRGSLPVKNSDTLLDMNPISKDQIGDALLIVSIILSFAAVALMIPETFEETGLLTGMSMVVSGVVLCMIGIQIKRGIFDSWFTRSD